MENALSKPERIRKAATVYKNDPNLALRDAAKIYDCSPQSILNHLNEKNKPAPNIYAANKRLSPVEECVLVAHIMQAYQSGFSLTIQHLNDFATELLLMKGYTQPIGKNWHLKFFARHAEIKTMFARSMDRQRMKAENPDEFIEWFRRFHATRVKWGVVDDDIHNMDESGCAMGLEQKPKVIVPSIEARAVHSQIACTFRNDEISKTRLTQVCLKASGRNGMLVAAKSSHLNRMRFQKSTG